MIHDILCTKVNSQSACYHSWEQLIRKTLNEDNRGLLTCRLALPLLLLVVRWTAEKVC